MRLDYLKKHRRGTYTSYLVTFKLNAHLAEINEEATRQIRELTEAFAQASDITKQLEATDQLRWVQEMNNCNAQDEEIVLREVVYPLPCRRDGA